MTQRTKFVLLALTIALVWALFFLWLAIMMFKQDLIGLGIFSYGIMAIGSGVILETTRQ